VNNFAAIIKLYFGRITPELLSVTLNIKQAFSVIQLLKQI